MPVAVLNDTAQVCEQSDERLLLAGLCGVVGRVQSWEYVTLTVSEYVTFLPSDSRCTVISTAMMCLQSSNRSSWSGQVHAHVPSRVMRTV